MTPRNSDRHLTELESLLNRLALESINIPVQKIDIQLNKLLMLIGKYAKAERCYILNYSENLTRIGITHYWARRGFTPDINSIKTVSNPRYRNVKKSELIVIPDIHSLEQGRYACQSNIYEQKIKSALLVPLIVNNVRRGFLGISTARRLTAFPDELKSVFRIAAELIVNLYEKMAIYMQLELTESIVSRTTGQLAFFDRNGQLQFANASFTKKFITGLSSSKRSDFYKIFSSRSDVSLDKLTRVFNTALSGRETNMEIWVRNRENLSLYEIFLHPNKKNHNSITGVIFNARDITDRVQLEAGILKAINQERKRIGILLHDDLGHDLLAADIRLKLLSDRMGNTAPDIAGELVDIEKSVKDMMNDVRRLSHGLIPFKNQGLDLREMLDAASLMMNKYYGQQCSYSIHPDVNITSENVINELYNIIIESSVNAVKHSECDTITIDLSPEKNLYVMKITDNGLGIQETNGRFPGAGMEIMKYRARSIGGLLEITGSRESGTTVKVSFNPERINL